MIVHQTPRLALRRLSLDDVDFILELLNEPAFIRYIGDKGVRDTTTARKYLENAPLASYAQHDFGLYAVQLRSTGELAGMCGLLKRDSLEHPDIGFAFLERYRGQGLAAEAAHEVLTHARDVRKLPCVLAITSLDNDASGRVLERCGLTFVNVVQLANQKEQLKLYSTRW